jgi:beta-glucosidase
MLNSGKDFLVRLMRSRQRACCAVLAAAAVTVAIVQLLSGQERALYQDPTAPVDQRVADLIARMTLDEKAAQTGALWLQKRSLVDAAGEFDPAKGPPVLGHGIGQITRPSDGMERGGKRRNARETVIFVNAIQKWVLEHTRLAIPVMFHEEALHGLAALGGTHFPVPIALASTWDDALLERVFTIAARETRARGSQQVLAPVVDLARDPRWGRTEETYGEDPYLVSRMGLAAVRGYQGPQPGPLAPDHVFATMKHFAAHGSHEGGINAAPANYSVRYLRDQLLMPFEVAITQGHAMGVMPSYNEIDGVPSHGNRWLLETVLRQEWGFQGVVVSDYNGINELMGRHHVAGSLADAAKLALQAGVDLELPDRTAYGTLQEEVRSGRIPEALLDRAVAHVLRAKFLAGLFEHPYADEAFAETSANTSDAQAVALEAARKSIILLKNDGNVLPLDRTKITTLAVIGPNAADVHLGGYSEDPGRGVSVLQGIRDKVGSSLKVVYAEGTRITEDKPVWAADKVTPGDPALNRKRIQDAVAVAKTADVSVVVIGTNEATSREAWSDTHLGDTATLDLMGQQDALVRALVALGKPVVLFLINGRPVALPEVAASAPAILEGWYLGQEGGTAAADVLFGDVNPGGKLPISIPRSVGQLPVNYDRKPTSFRNYLFFSRAPLFPFGHGLSYTSFRLEGLKVTPDAIGTGGTSTVSVNVTNTGARAGDEVVQLYIRDRVSSVTRPVKELRGFARVPLKPGETRAVSFTVGPEALWLTNVDMQRVVEPGTFDILVGSSSETSLSATLEVR